jgi:hypothetical protein
LPISDLKKKEAKMVKLTMTARVTDGQTLAAGLDDGRNLKNGDCYKFRT